MKSMSEMTAAEKIDERIRLRWELDAAGQKEFAGNFEIYQAYYRAERKELIGGTKKEVVEEITPLPRHLAPHQIEQELQARWNRSKALRDEFGGNIAPFRAYCIAKSKGLCA